jgi:hypothetical protein
MTFLYELLGILVIYVLAFTLPVRTVISIGMRPFVKMQATPAQGFKDIFF